MTDTQKNDQTMSFMSTRGIIKAKKNTNWWPSKWNNCLFFSLSLFSVVIIIIFFFFFSCWSKTWSYIIIGISTPSIYLCHRHPGGQDSSLSLPYTFKDDLNFPSFFFLSFFLNFWVFCLAWIMMWSKASYEMTIYS